MYVSFPRQSFTAACFPPSTTTNLHVAHIWAFIHERSGHRGGYLMRGTHKEIWQALFFCLLCDRLDVDRERV